MLDLLRQPWPWYIGGPLIGLTVPLLLLLGNKPFGISSSLRHICAACIPGNLPYFKYNWKAEIWNLFFVAGIMLGGLIAGALLKSHNTFIIASNTKMVLQSNHITDYTGLLPSDLFSWSSLFTIRGFIVICVGGFLVGFGTRYAAGCTSGHAIMGLSNLQWPSLVATIGFMLGGIIATWFLLPWILKL